MANIRLDMDESPNQGPYSGKCCWPGSRRCLVGQWQERTWPAGLLSLHLWGGPQAVCASHISWKQSVCLKHADTERKPKSSHGAFRAACQCLACCQTTMCANGNNSFDSQLNLGNPASPWWSMLLLFVCHWPTCCCFSGGWNGFYPCALF